MLIATGNFTQDRLSGSVVIVTGAGGGIGFEAARSLLWLGARVVIAEIDTVSGKKAEERLAAEWPRDRFAFVPTDVSDETSIRRLCEIATDRFGKIDVVLNNATYAPVGTAVAETPIETWDRSYAVNLRGPVMLARAVLPEMMARKRGVFVCVSSTGGPYLAAYETLKAAQVALGNSLDAELADTGVIAFTIGPGLVPTRTATAAIELLAPRLGMSVDEFWKTNGGAVLSVEAAGAGFAAAIAMAERYAGQETSSVAALIDAGINVPSDRPVAARSNGADPVAALQACQAVRQTLAEQAAGWKQRSFFERQWMQRDFKQRVGIPIERCLESLEQMQNGLTAGKVAGLESDHLLLEKLDGFYAHLSKLAAGYVKDPPERDKQLRIVAGWRSEVDKLAALT